MPNYQLGKIYKIVCNTSELVYYGSTCESTLARRLSSHRSSYESWKTSNRKYVSSFKVLENDNYDIILVEFCPCNDKMELHQRERYFIESNDCVNRVIPLRTPLEYEICHREQIKETKRKYRESHLLQRAEYDAIYRMKNSDKIKERIKEVYECKCGNIIRKKTQLKHNLTLKHIAIMNNREVNEDTEV
jgi:hypothetical protein